MKINNTVLASIKYILYPFSFIYGTIVSVRNLFFDVGILRSQRFPVKIICIGNLSVGGTGKSPHAEYIARLLDRQNNGITYKNIAVLSRGYGRKTKGFRLVNDSSTAAEVGDEPLQLKRKLNNITVAVAEKRVEGIRKLMELNKELKVVILDDAYQHRYVKPDLTILLTSYYQPFFEDTMLPAGRLREPRRGYKRAQVVIVTNTPPSITSSEKEIIVRRIKPGKKQLVFFSSVSYESLVPVYKNELTSPAINKNHTVLLVTAIANAQVLHSHLASIARDVIHISFADHHAFSNSDIHKVLKKYEAITNPDKIIVTTEKDTMRLQEEGVKKKLGELPIFYIPIQVKVDNEEKLEELFIQSMTR